jgi:putative ABC transport system permease protein
VRSGITRHALRRHRATLLGPAATQVLAGLVMSMMMNAVYSVNRLAPDVRSTPAVVDALDFMRVFVGNAVYLAVIIVGVTMNLAASGQLRDIALLRTIGATPGQVRRSLALQAAGIALPAGLVGAVLGVPLAWGWLVLLRNHGVVPASTKFGLELASVPRVVAIVFVTSLVGTVVAVIRTSRVSPASALTETMTGLRAVRPVRTVVGMIFVSAGVTLSAVLAVIAPKQAGDVALFVLLAECVGVGLLGPVILGRFTRWVRPMTEGITRIAVDDLATMTRKLSSALIPIVLAAAFAGIKIAAHTTAGTGTGPADELWVDFSGTSIFCAFAGVAALNCFATVVITRRHSLAAIQLAGASRRDLIVMTAIEVFIVAGVAAVLAAGVACATLIPILHQSLGVWFPRVPLSVLLVWIATICAVVAVGMLMPTARFTLRRPIRVALTAE